MANKKKPRDFAQVLTWLRGHGFEVQEQKGGAYISKAGCAARLEADGKGSVRVSQPPGVVLGGAIAALIDKGYQKVLKTEKTEVAATAEHLNALHDFAEGLREALGATSLYNEALGTVSDRYVYDRVVGRDDSRPKPRPWERASKSSS